MLDKSLLKPGYNVRDPSGMVGKIEELLEYTFKVRWLVSGSATMYGYDHKDAMSFTIVNDNWESIEGLLYEQGESLLSDKVKIGAKVAHKLYKGMNNGMISEVGPNNLGVGPNEVRVAWRNTNDYVHHCVEKIADLLFLKPPTKVDSLADLSERRDGKFTLADIMRSHRGNTAQTTTSPTPTNKPENVVDKPYDTGKTYVGAVPGFEIADGGDFGAAIVAVSEKKAVEISVDAFKRAATPPTETKSGDDTCDFKLGDLVSSTYHPSYGVGKFIERKTLAPNMAEVEWPDDVGTYFTMPVRIDSLVRTKPPASWTAPSETKINSGEIKQSRLPTFAIGERVYHGPSSSYCYFLSSLPGTGCRIQTEETPKIERYTDLEAIYKCAQANNGDRVFLPDQKVFGIVKSTDMELGLTIVKISPKRNYVVEVNKVKKVDPINDYYVFDHTKVEGAIQPPADPDNDQIIQETFRSGRVPSYTNITGKDAPKLAGSPCFEKGDRVSIRINFIGFVEGKVGTVVEATVVAAMVRWGNNGNPIWHSAASLTKVVEKKKLDVSNVVKVETKAVPETTLPIVLSFQEGQRVKDISTGKTGTVIKLTKAGFAEVGLDQGGSSVIKWIAARFLVPLDEAVKAPVLAAPAVKVLDPLEEAWGIVGCADVAAKIFGRKVVIKDNRSSQGVFECLGDLQNAKPEDAYYRRQGAHADICYGASFVVLAADQHQHNGLKLDLVLKCVECGRIENDGDRQWDPEAIKIEQENSTEFAERRKGTPIPKKDIVSVSDKTDLQKLAIAITAKHGGYPDSPLVDGISDDFKKEMAMVGSPTGDFVNAVLKAG